MRRNQMYEVAKLDTLVTGVQAQVQLLMVTNFLPARGMRHTAVSIGFRARQEAEHKNLWQPDL